MGSLRARVIWAFTALIVSVPSFADGFLDQIVAENFVEPVGANARYIGIEVELIGPSIIEVLEKAKQKLCVYGDANCYYEKVKSYPDGREEWVLKNSLVGHLTVKDEPNQTTERMTAKRLWVHEIVTEKMTWAQLQLFHEFEKELPGIGAKGTYAEDGTTYSIATQVNIDVEPDEKIPGLTERIAVELIRLYLLPKNYRKIRRELEVPRVQRGRFLGFYSHAYMQWLMQPDYYPSKERLMTDMVYRQTAAAKGFPYAWVAPAEVVRNYVLKYVNTQPNPIVPSAIKLHSIRFTSWLMWALPHDEMAQFIKKQGWANAYPAWEMRDGNTDFDSLRMTKRMLSLYLLARKRALEGLCRSQIEAKTAAVPDAS